MAKLSDRGEREDASVGAEAVLASGGRLRRNGLAGNSKDQVVSPTLGRTPRGLVPATMDGGTGVRRVLGLNLEAEGDRWIVRQQVVAGPDLNQRNCSPSTLLAWGGSRWSRTIYPT